MYQGSWRRADSFAAEPKLEEAAEDEQIDENEPQRDGEGRKKRLQRPCREEGLGSFIVAVTVVRSVSLWAAASLDTARPASEESAALDQPLRESIEERESAEIGDG